MAGIKQFATTEAVGAVREWVKTTMAGMVGKGDFVTLVYRVAKLEEAMQRAGGEAIVDAIEVARRRGHQDVAAALKEMALAPHDAREALYPAYLVSQMIERIEKGGDP